MSYTKASNPTKTVVPPLKASSSQLPVPRGTKTSITDGVIHSDKQAGVPVRKV